MKRLLLLFCCLQGGILVAQDFDISGKIVNAQDVPLSYVTVLLYNGGSETPLKGTTSEADGSFVIKELKAGSYRLTCSYVGFEEYSDNINLTSDLKMKKIHLAESSQMLDETIVRANLPKIKKTAGKLVFNVENTSLSVGSTMDLLKKTPGVVVIGESIQVKFATPTIYINGKRVYLSSAEITALLENTDAANIKSIEVITNPSAAYDADSGTVLNIVSSRAISIGYKGAVAANYTQGIYPKYSLGTSHFYKNDWVNLFAGYTYNTKKQFKEDESYIRFFQEDEVSTKSIWETYFSRTTDADSHTGNVVLDFTLDDKNTIGITSNISLAPNNTYHNNGNANIYNPQRQLDSLNTTLSDVDYKKDNLAFALDYNRTLNESGANLAISGNYIYYNHIQDQSVSTDYFLPNDFFIRNNSFSTASAQKSNIFTAQVDFSTVLFGGTFDAGIKYSNINTHSNLDFFDVVNNSKIFNSGLSDDFDYKENIFAEYINFEKAWKRWIVNAGLRGEYTNTDAISAILGEVNSQKSFEIFPSASLNYSINDNNSLGLAYNRSIQRPRYESLNPFKYFITENNFIGGNPKLVPAIEDKITLSYAHKNKLFFELYYQNVQNGLENLSFQNNQTSSLRTLEDNLEKVYQYSFDITYFTSLSSWWYFHLTTSSFYLSNTFKAVESAQKTYTNDTFGQYLGLYNHFTLTKDRSLTADLSALYISNFVFGNRYFKNQTYVNLSVKKEFWNKRANITVGVDDIFNTLNDLASVSKYYNQDNRFLVNQESRLFRVGFKYNFGNARLGDNSKQITTEEGDRLNGK